MWWKWGGGGGGIAYDFNVGEAGPLCVYVSWGKGIVYILFLVSSLFVCLSEYDFTVSSLILLLFFN